MATSMSGTMSNCRKSQTVFPWKPVQLRLAPAMASLTTIAVRLKPSATSVRTRPSNRSFHISGRKSTIRRGCCQGCCQHGHHHPHGPQHPPPHPPPRRPPWTPKTRLLLPLFGLLGLLLHHNPTITALMNPRRSKILHLYPPPQHVEPSHAAWRASHAILAALVHIQNRYRVRRYSENHETSDLRPFTFGHRKRAVANRATLQRRFRHAPSPDHPRQRQG